MSALHQTLLGCFKEMEVSLDARLFELRACVCIPLPRKHETKFYQVMRGPPTRHPLLPRLQSSSVSVPKPSNPTKERLRQFREQSREGRPHSWSRRRSLELQNCCKKPQRHLLYKLAKWGNGRTHQASGITIILSWSHNLNLNARGMDIIAHLDWGAGTFLVVVLRVDSHNWKTSLTVESSRTYKQ